MRPPTATLVFSLLSILSYTVAQTTTASAAAAGASPDGLIVPFSSSLPACASKCGPLFDVQGGCAPPVTSSADKNCFCADTRLATFNNDGGVSLICGAQSCTAPADQQAVRNWYSDFCAEGQAVVATTAAATASNGAIPTQTGVSVPQSTPVIHPTWIAAHYKWVIMIVVIFFAIVGGWIGACLLRRRYLRKKEREIEMNPPVAWGPHQMQGATGGYNYGSGVIDTSGGGLNNAAGYAKEYAAAAVTPTDGRKSKRESKALQKKNRFT